MGSRNYKDLIVWQKALDLVIIIYKLTELLPKSEIFGLTSQMRRCAVSIPSNIAEGSKRGTEKDFRQFLIIALGSGAELETQLIMVDRLYAVDKLIYNQVISLLAEVMRMLGKMTVSMQVKVY